MAKVLNSLNKRREKKLDSKLKNKEQTNSAKASKVNAKAAVKISKAKAREILAEKGIDQGGEKTAKVLDTLNVAIAAADNIATKGKGGGIQKSEPAREQEPEQKEKKSFSFTSWYMLLIYALVLAGVIYLIYVNF